MPIEGTVVITDSQSEGRGQRQNSWVSEAGLNLTCSLILRPVFLAAKDQFILSAAVALAVAETIDHFFDEQEQIKIKWPNDILVNGQKIAGILIENTLRKTNLETSIVGIGLNVNQIDFPTEINATSLKQLTDSDIQIETVLDGLCSNLEKYYLQIRNGIYNPVLELMNHRLFGLGRKMSLKINGAVTKVSVSKVLLSGQLELLHEDGNTSLHMHHEIDWML
jgi:BirA family biotin operon repressor/biotin-[acetyl-CoA-carboxylase] ligase